MSSPGPEEGSLRDAIEPPIGTLYTYSALVDDGEKKTVKAKDARRSTLCINQGLPWLIHRPGAPLDDDERTELQEHYVQGGTSAQVWLALSVP